jgi:hypothetical protein
MNYRRLLLFGLFFVVFLGISIYGIRLYAQDRLPALVVHPSNFDLTYQGAPTTQTVTLDNTTDQPLTIQAVLRNFTANGEEGAVSLTNEDTGYSLAKWIQVTPNTVTIPAHMSQDFTFSITPPANAEPGGHYGSIVFSTIPGQTNKGTGASVSEQVASLILYRIPGNTDDNANVESFTTDKNFYEFGPVTFDLRVQNLGQVHIQPLGQVIVTGTFGDKYILNIQPYNVLPTAIRRIPIIFSKKLLFGKYTAHLVAAYGSTNKQLTADTEFYAFPVEYGIIVLVIIVFLFLIRKRLGKAFKAILTGK